MPNESFGHGVKIATPRPSTYMVEEGLRRLHRARNDAASMRFARAAAADAAAESFGRQALAGYASAMNWLEGSEHFETAHDELHDVGRYCREEFPEGCDLTAAGDDFAQTCPVSLAHKRVGFSMGFTGNAICSICDSDVTECPHRPGNSYEVVAATHPDGRCNICGSKACAHHLTGQTYEAETRVSITEIYEIDHIALVAQPVQPDARLTSISISRRELETHLGYAIADGQSVRCDQCLGECQGFTQVGPGH